MPPSQLKRLKASLREQGVTGPQKSKKQKKAQRKDADQRAHKSAALASIRESFNPFEFKHLSRPNKHQYTTSQSQNANRVLGRPGVTKSQGEETRRKTLLPEMHKRNKVGGILDRRIGENDPTMSLEDRMMARFEREQQRKRGGHVFDLEEGDEEVALTHGGRAIHFDDETMGGDDYDAASISGSDDGDVDSSLTRKRRREPVEEDGEESPDEEQPERKKSKAEVMKEVIAKSKLHKYERQQQKEDDDDLRDELDKDLNDVLAALRGHSSKPAPAPATPNENDFSINPERAALLAGKSRDEADKEYDARVRQLLHDQRSRPTERTKTEEELAEERAKELLELEQKRLRRMRGGSMSDDNEAPNQRDEANDEEIPDDAAQFGLAATPSQPSRPEGIEDEDDFELENDLIASDSEADISEGSEDESEMDDAMAIDDDEDFLKVVRPESKESTEAVNGVLTLDTAPKSSKLAYTYTCPRSHEELLKVFKGVATEDISTVIQRIRALYHAGLHAENKEKLADFGCALVDHIAFLTNSKPPAPLAVIESVIRHIHSLAKTYPQKIATQFRAQLKRIQDADNLTPGDLTIFTAISSIFSVSDWFHQVCTPSITLMARWLGLNSPQSEKDVATGAYIGALALQYNQSTHRYIPEFIRYTDLCLKSKHATPALLKSHTQNILRAADRWTANPSFIEIFTPLLPALQSAHQLSTVQNLHVRLQNAQLRRRPQLLHRHRPLPIKTAIPKFEESFDPNKHYDPDKERAEAAKLKKEYKRERKGALRELRKDANFMARQSLREKKEKDRAYEERYRKLVAEIQGEEGREANAYEREKRARKRKT